MTASFWLTMLIFEYLILRPVYLDWAWRYLNGRR